jgi:predicted DNA binding CopG/RHH family protein
MAFKKTKMEKEMLNALYRGKLKRSAKASEEMEAAQKAAKNYLKKDNRINIRISGTDLNQIKQKASEEGIPYQTLISSILHKFLNGNLVNKH